MPPRKNSFTCRRCRQTFTRSADIRRRYCDQCVSYIEKLKNLPHGKYEFISWINLFDTHPNPDFMEHMKHRVLKKSELVDFIRWTDFIGYTIRHESGTEYSLTLYDVIVK